jgi:hypothetical protein
MPDIVAIISKGIFEQQAKKGGKLLGPGAVLSLDRYDSKNKALAALAQGGRLVLVTVRPPNERLWLVAVLERLAQDASGWRAAAPNRAPITDISPLRKTLRLASGKGLSQDKGALGMSLQTPRALAPEDMIDLLAALTGPDDGLATLPQGLSPTLRALASDLAKTPDNESLRERVARGLASEGAATNAAKLLARHKHLNAHEPREPGVTSLPCLCKKCFGAAPLEVSAGGITFGRDFVLKSGRVLHFWAPVTVLELGGEMLRSVRAALGRQLAALAKARKVRARKRAEERTLARQKKGTRSR